MIFNKECNDIVVYIYVINNMNNVVNIYDFNHTEYFCFHRSLKCNI